MKVYDLNFRINFAVALCGKEPYQARPFQSFAMRGGGGGGSEAQMRKIKVNQSTD